MTTAYALEANLKNKGNYVGNLTGKIQEQRLQDNRTRASFASLASSYSLENAWLPPIFILDFDSPC